MRPDVPKIAANNRLKGSTEENIPIAQESMAFFGTWTLIDAKTGEVGLHVLGSSFPNWIGNDQKRFVTAVADMTISNPASPSAGKSALTLKRIK